MAVVQAIITRQHIAQCNCQQIVGHSVKSEHFKADQQRGNWAVGDTAEYGSHTSCCAKSRRKSYKISIETTEGASDDKGRDNLSAFKSRAECDCCKNHFQQKSIGHIFIFLKALGNYGHSSAIVVLILHQQGQNDNKCPSGENSQIRIGKIFLIKF